MKRVKYPPIIKARREYFGGVIFRERPAFLVHVDRKYAQAHNIPKNNSAIMVESIYSAPLDAHMAITTKCNLYCEGCYNICRDDEQKDMPLDKAKAIVDKLSQLGVFSLSFGGGEPTLHPQILDIAAYTRRKQILPNMTTNGLTMTEDFAEKCSVFGNVHFSIHKPSDLNHVIAAVRVYKESTGNKPGINLLLTKETVPHLDDLLHNIKKAGIRKVLLLRYKTTEKNTDTGWLSVDDNISDMPGLFKRLQREHKRIMFLYDCSLFEVLAESGIVEADTCRKYDGNGCMGANAYIAINTDGMYKPCSFWYETFGSVLDIDFESWIYNAKLNDFRNKRKSDTCTQCGFVRFCNGGCRLTVGY